MARAKSNKSSDNSSANIGFEAKLWVAADKLRSNMDAAEYKHVVLGLIFLKYISDSFEEHHAKLVAGEGEYAGANPDDPDEYRAENIFWVPPAARRQRITLGAVTFGLIVSIVLAVVAFFARHKAVEQEAKAKNTSVQADFDLAVMYRQKPETVDPRVLAHLARALKTSGSARLPREYLVSLLRDAQWHLPETEPMCHDGKVYAASFSPDRRRIVTVFNDKTARVWDAESGKPLGESMRHDGKVYAASFSPDGRRILTISEDKTARLWDAESGKPLGESMRHDGKVYAASFSPDGRRI
jgi:HsdM N-terminal domain/WD domain, G-beta repeat